MNVPLPLRAVDFLHCFSRPNPSTLRSRTAPRPGLSCTGPPCTPLPFLYRLFTPSCCVSFPSLLTPLHQPRPPLGSRTLRQSPLVKEQTSSPRALRLLSDGMTLIHATRTNVNYYAVKTILCVTPEELPLQVPSSLSERLRDLYRGSGKMSTDGTRRLPTASSDGSAPH